MNVLERDILESTAPEIDVYIDIGEVGYKQIKYAGGAEQDRVVYIKLTARPGQPDLCFMNKLKEFHIGLMAVRSCEPSLLGIMGRPGESLLVSGEFCRPLAQMGIDMRVL